MEHIRLSLLARDAREKAHAEMIEQYRRLAQQTVVLKERNAALLRAGNSGAGAASGGGGGGAGAGAAGGDNPVRAAFLASLETQLAQTRGELSEQYKIQSSNAQRLLALTDNLRDAEERGRDEREELRRLRSEVEGLRERSRWHKEVVAEKEKQLLILQDDHASLSLELSQVTLQNENLKIDNSSLLQRWIESKNEEAARMNDANNWIEEAARRKEKEAKELEREKEKEKIGEGSKVLEKIKAAEKLGAKGKVK